MQSSGMTNKGIPETAKQQPATYLKATQKVGSIKGQLNYTQDQNCFSHWEDPIHNGSAVQQIVRDVKRDIDRDTLGTKQPKWNQSVGIIGHPPADSHSNTLFQIKHGLKDETIVNMKAQKTYVGTDTRDSAYSGWNVSTQVVHPRDSERFL
jgi:hypothetical protein